MFQVENNINIPAIILVNLFGLIILFTIAIGSDWRYFNRSKPVKALMLMALSVTICCILEPVAFLLDGINSFIGYSINTLYSFCYCLWPIGWAMMIAGYLDVKITRVRKFIMGGYLVIMALILIINLFIPIVFHVDDKGVYTRSGGYLYVLGFALIFIFDGTFMSYKARKRSNHIKFFPVWAFLIPAIIGRVIQTIWYGISAAVPFLAVSLSCCALCMQNERFYRDSLTLLYNRAYLNTLEKRLSHRLSHAYTAIFLDVNSFKNINDTYGHIEGDNALILIADVLRDSVSDKGEVIRYAGDEFFILYNSPDNDEVENLLKSIDDKLASLPVDPEKPYHLSVSAGFCSLDFRFDSMNKVLDKVDKIMYEKKRDYYRNNTHIDRRTVR